MNSTRFSLMVIDNLEEATNVMDQVSQIIGLQWITVPMGLTFCRKLFEISTNAAGSDGIPVSFIKMLSPFILAPLCHLFNTIIDSRTFSNQWKTAIITPIPKTACPSVPKDFRPISVLSAVSKVLEKILLGQITFGQPQQTSTSTKSIWLQKRVRYAKLDESRCTIMVLVDFPLAFNCVDHGRLESKLNSEFIFARGSCDLIASFLSQRQQAVKHGNEMSAVRSVTDGTPQGSCLSALLFTLYINSLPLELECNYQPYADYLQVYISGPIADVHVLVERIKKDLDAITRWASGNHLHPNPKKTQAIIFSRTGVVAPRRNIQFSGEVVPLLDKVIYMGCDGQQDDLGSSGEQCGAKIFQHVEKFPPLLFGAIW